MESQYEEVMSLIEDRGAITVTSLSAALNLGSTEEARSLLKRLIATNQVTWIRPTPRTGVFFTTPEKASVLGTFGYKLVRESEYGKRSRVKASIQGRRWLRLCILMALRGDGPLTKLQMANNVEYSVHTIDKYLVWLIQNGLIEEVERPPEPNIRRSRGRPVKYWDITAQGKAALMKHKEEIAKVNKFIEKRGKRREAKAKKEAEAQAKAKKR